MGDLVDSSQYGLARVLEAYREDKFRDELWGEWASLVFYRPLSLLLTPVFLRAGIGANLVSIVSILPVLLLPLLALREVSNAYVAVAICAIVYEIVFTPGAPDTITGSGQDTINDLNVGEFDVLLIDDLLDASAAELDASLLVDVTDDGFDTVITFDTDGSGTFGGADASISLIGVTGAFTDLQDLEAAGIVLVV